MQTRAEKTRLAANLWTARIVPVLLAGIVAYATYVLVALLCVNYLLVRHHEHGSAIAILVVYFLLFTLMAFAFFRLAYLTTFDPPYVPLGIKHSDEGVKRVRHSRKNQERHGFIESHQYTPADPSQTLNNDPDSPGLEQFYTRDVFVCEQDGRPRWCSSCANWKPDRAHHCHLINRCILKMDHYCPWVGGPIGESTFKFFIQFTSYAASYCIIVLVVMAYYIHRQLRSESEKVNPQFWVVLGLAAFFGLFTAGMAGTSINLALRNLTQVEQLNLRTRVHTLAVFIAQPDNPSGNQPIMFPTIVYPLTNTLRATNNQSSGIVESPESHSPATSSVRDQKAKRTFAVLQTNVGQHPWHLGSFLLNWNSVMGDNIFDWILPIKRSPCCNHEDTESYFPMGPALDSVYAQLRARNPEALYPSKDAAHRRRQRSKRSRRHHHSRHKADKRRRTPSRPVDSSEMRDLHVHRSRSRRG